ncbi:MAG: MiaB/RimO family radical SAM methylthiotransferase, partial [Deferribacteraceae bacterium]|nr:MiaB/RimO family radical SAM methylthiotransferase [Deferribacteraceae bacterium]
MKKVAFISFGCKVNSAETDTMIAQLADLAEAKYCKTTTDADIVIVNTCAVTEKAQKEGERYLRTLKEKKPACTIIATGCMAELYKGNEAAIGADMLVPNVAKGELLRVLFPKSNVGARPTARAAKPAKTRAFLKIQDGCDAFCTYCIIPSLRGAPTSISEDEAVAAFQRLLCEGYKEIVLTGIHIGLYESGLDKLLARLIALDGEFRIRLSSLYVTEITDELIQIVARSNGKIAPHFHISLQSGSTEILRRMGRKYSASKAEELIHKLRKEIADVTIGADIIVGFPDEGIALFLKTLHFVESCKFDFLHVFPYSARPNTPAASYDDQIPQEEKLSRARMLRGTGNALQRQSAERLVGQTVRVLTEK